MEKFARATPGATHRLHVVDGADRTNREGKIMNKLTRRVAVTASSVAVASAAVLGAGGTASAAPSASAHVQRPAVSVNAGDHRWDHGVGYLLELGYSWDEIRGWCHDVQVEISVR
ncbi:hypothetical protein ABZ402_48925 [Streptomyces mirabilis]|uniref:hypothetical protein n=2 Tax=Streptomyces mirabilis TaxID=68239 RepID=UPI0033D2511A